jgi:hypothetical protein
MKLCNENIKEKEKKKMKDEKNEYILKKKGPS